MSREASAWGNDLELLTDRLFLRPAEEDEVPFFRRRRRLARLRRGFLRPAKRDAGNVEVLRFLRPPRRPRRRGTDLLFFWGPFLFLGLFALRALFAWGKAIKAPPRFLFGIFFLSFFLFISVLYLSFSKAFKGSLFCNRIRRSPAFVTAMIKLYYIRG